MKQQDVGRLDRAHSPQLSPRLSIICSDDAVQLCTTSFRSTTKVLQILAMPWLMQPLSEIDVSNTNKAGYPRTALSLSHLNPCASDPKLAQVVLGHQERCCHQRPACKAHRVHLSSHVRYGHGIKSLQLCDSQPPCLRTDLVFSITFSTLSVWCCFPCVFLLFV